MHCWNLEFRIEVAADTSDTNSAKEIQAFFSRMELRVNVCFIEPNKPRNSVMFNHSNNLKTIQNVTH